MNKIELLAPAGSYEGMKAVITAGANAVYIGGSRFGARAYADNPPEDMLLAAIDYAHLRHVRLYLTVNTLLKEEELNELGNFLLPYYERGVDGVLVQDFGVLLYLRRHFPDLPLHASTQMTVTGPAAAKMLKTYGVTRIVPARELSLPELAAIHDESGLEVEAFVHGALCYCYSGQCLLSSMLGGRSGNRGRCAQPCRLPYSAGGMAGTLLSPKDLCTIDLLPEIIRAGVVSLKIEGRMKQTEYAAGVVSIYRRYLDLFESDPAHYKVSEKDRKTLTDLFNREGFTDGYLTRRNGPVMMALHGGEDHTDPHIRDGIYAKMHEKYVENEIRIPVSGRADFEPGTPCTMTLQAEGVSVTVSGACVQEAKNMPLEKERIKEQLEKTGGTDFILSDLEIKCSGRVFLPMKELNLLRRSALEALSEALLKDGRRKAGEILPEKAEKTILKTGGAPSLSVSVENKEQLFSVLSAGGVSRIYYPALRIDDGVRDACHTHGAALFAALPHVRRMDQPDLSSVQADGFLVRSLESYAILKEKGLLNRTAADSSLYTWNRLSQRFFRQDGILMDTAPAELNKKELFGRDNTQSELIVYGRLPLMVSAQCLRKNTEACTKTSGMMKLTDRKGTDFLVCQVCDFCYNILYNSVPTNLVDEGDAILRMGFSSVRLSFTDEGPDACRKITEDFIRSFVKGEAVKPSGAHTKGHFGRGAD